GVLSGGEKQIFGFGQVGDTDRRTPGGDTVFDVGSITELFFGLAFAELVTEGKVPLDAPARELLPPGVVFPAHGHRDPTLVEPPAHSPGLPPLPANFVEQDRKTTVPSYTPAMLYDALASSTPTPGAFHYSYFGVGLLGHLLALREGTTYRDLVAARVLQ